MVVDTDGRIWQITKAALRVLMCTVNPNAVTKWTEVIVKLFAHILFSKLTRLAITSLIRLRTFL